MAIAAVFEFRDESVDAYEKVYELGGDEISAQPKRLSHVCYRTEGGFTVVDVWEDEESFGAFGEVLGPTLAKVGVEPAGGPQIYPVQGFVLEDGKRRI